MKKIFTLLIIVAISIVLVGCNQVGDQSVVESSENTQKGEAKNEDNERSSHSSHSESGEGTREPEELNSNLSSTESSVTVSSESEKMVEINFETTFREGTYRYKKAYREAKEAALLEQAPDEYEDYVFLADTLENFTPWPVMHQHFSSSTEEQKATERTRIEKDVAEALVLKEQMKDVNKTINVVKEYSKLERLIRETLANEKYLK